MYSHVVCASVADAVVGKQFGQIMVSPCGEVESIPLFSMLVNSSGVTVTVFRVWYDLGVVKEQVRHVLVLSLAT